MRNLLIIAIDTLRPDHLRCHGYPRETAPRIEQLAGQSALFDACWSASNFTAPAFTSLFTGLYPHHHGVFDFRAQAVASPIYDCLRSAGVRMGGVVTFRFFGRLLKEIWGEIEAVTDTRSGDYAKELPRAVTDCGIDWLRDHDRQQPFALFLHYGGPHMPYRLPEEHVGRFGDPADPGVPADLRAAFFPQQIEQYGNQEMGRLFDLIAAIDRGRRSLDAATLQWLVDRYDELIYYTDAEIGRLLDGLSELGLADDTVVCLLSDHGEELMDHGHLAHAGIHLHESTVRTLGLIFDPARAVADRIATPVSHTQLLPFLLREAGVPDLPADWRARDLLGPPLGAAEPVFCIGEFKAAVRLGDLKFITRRILPQHPPLKKLRLLAKLVLMREWGDQLFDLRADPQERRNLVGDRRRRDPLARILRRELASAPPRIESNTAATLSAAERERIEQEMRDLGYM